MRTKLLLLAMILGGLFAAAVARLPEIEHGRSSPMRLPTDPAEASARTDTFFLFAADGPGAYGMPGTSERGYSFDGPYGELQEAGWYGLDATAQEGNWWHIAEVSLSAGTDTDMSAALPFDYPADPENSYAAWCGRSETCGWENEMGYGNNWDQWMRVNLDASSELVIDFDYSADVEGAVWDYFQVLVEVDGILEEFLLDNTEGPSGFLSRQVQAAGNLGDVVFSFTSDSAYSDQDGLFDTNLGAVWIDNLVIQADGQQVFAADFEDGLLPMEIEFAGAPGAGEYAALYDELPDLFPSGLSNDTHAWAFFDSLTLNPQYGNLPVIPYGPPYVENYVISPALEVDSSGAGFLLNTTSTIKADFWVYLYPVDGSLLFQHFQFAARPVGQECFGNWVDFNLWYNEPGWWNWRIDLTELLSESSGSHDYDAIRVALGIVDMCDIWCDSDGDGQNHHPGPFYDNVSIFILEEPTSIDETAFADRIVGVHPNPFNPSTKIAFSMASGGKLELRVYDISGRLQRTLWDGHHEPGHHELEWDGTDERGHRLASGVYFLRFAAGDVVEERKLVLLK